MKNITIKTLFVALILAFSINIYSQTETKTDTTKVSFVAYWSKGDSYKFKMVKSIEKFKNEKSVRNDSIVYDAFFKVLDSTATLRRITITYNGLNCWGNRFRTGKVILTMLLGQRWIDQNAILTTTFENLKITRVSDNKSITINGIHEVKNLTGGRLGQLRLPGGPASIVHEITSPGMNVTFDNGTTRSWKVGKKRTFTYSPPGPNGNYVIKTEGIHTDGTTTGISEWGTNRFGNAFVTVISDPMIIRGDCDFRLVSGQVSHQRLNATAVVTFGLDATGNPTTCPGVGLPYYFKLVWTGANGVVRTFIRPY